MKASVRKTVLFHFLMWSLCLLICVGACEAVLRLFAPSPIFHHIDIMSHGAMYTLADNPRLVYKPKSNAGDFNSWGYRGQAHELKRNNKARIVCIGDSVLEGCRLTLEDRFTSLLEKSLQPDYEIINLGVRGYDFFQEIEYLRELGVRFSPDWVFWFITYNDLATASSEMDRISRKIDKLKNSEYYYNYYKMKGRAESVLMHSALYRWIKYKTSKRSSEKFIYATKKNKDDKAILRGLKTIRRLENKHSFSTLFIFLPVNTVRFSEDISRLEQSVKAMGFPSTNLNDFIDSQAPPREKASLFFDNDPCHLNEKGHEVMHKILKSTVRQIAGDE